MTTKQRIQELARTDRSIKNLANSNLAYNSAARQEQAAFLQKSAANLWKISQEETNPELRAVMQNKTAECYEASRNLREAS